MNHTYTMKKEGLARSHAHILVGRRSYPRKHCLIPVDYVINKRVYRDFIENISLKGAFIISRHQMTVGTEIVMTFAWQTGNQPIKSKATIIRSTPQGFAVQFPRPLAAP